MAFIAKTKAQESAAVPFATGVMPFMASAETAVRMMLKAQYFMPLYYAMILLVDEMIPTLCTDGIHLWINPKFWAQLSKDHRVTAVAHEIGHRFLLHTTRVGARNLLVWNMAGDYVINLMLVESGFVPLKDLVIDGQPWSWLYDEKYKGMTTEQVYDLLMKEIEKEIEDGKGKQQKPGASAGQKQSSTPGSQAGEGTAGQAAGDQAGSQAGQGRGENGTAAQSPGGNNVGQSAGQGEEDDGGTVGQHAADRLGPFRDLQRYGETTGGKDATTGKPLPTPAEFEQQIRKEVNEAQMRAKIAGTVPGWLERAIENANHSKVNWWDVYAEFLSSLHHADYSWHRFNKRMLATIGALTPDIYEPAMGGILFLVDCSGSIGRREFGIYSGHFKDTLHQVMPKWVEVVYFDTEVMRVERFDRCEYQGDPQRLKPKGGGGTDFRWFADYIDNMEEQPDVVTVLTDMYGPFGREPDLPAIWLSTSSKETAPYGKVISIN